MNFLKVLVYLMFRYVDFLKICFKFLYCEQVERATPMDAGAGAKLYDVPFRKNFKTFALENSSLSAAYVLFFSGSDDSFFEYISKNR